MDLNSDEDAHTMYSNLVQEVQNPPELTLNTLVEECKKSVWWHPQCKEIVKAALSADTGKLQQMGGGSEQLPARTIGTRILSHNRNLTKIKTGHQLKYLESIRKYISSLELARREAVRKNQGSEFLKASAYSQRQREEEQQQRQQQKPEHQQVNLGRGGQGNRGQPLSARSNHLAAAPMQPAPMKSNQGSGKCSLPVGPVPKYHGISSSTLLPPPRSGQQRQQQPEQLWQQQQQQQRRRRRQEEQQQNKQQQQQQQQQQIQRCRQLQQEQQQQQQQQQLHQQQQQQQQETRQKPIRSKAAQAKALPEPEIVSIPSSDEEEDNGQAPKAAPQHTRRSMRISSTHMEEHEFLGDMSFRYPPDDPKSGLVVKGIDLKFLRDEEFLNDTIMDFYIRYIHDQLPPKRRECCYFFNTFFYTKLTEKTPKTAQGGQPLPKDRAGHARVKKWVKNVNVFHFDYLLIPIHEGAHWSLIVVCHPSHVVKPEEEGQACILHLDSLDGGHASGPVFKHVRDFLRYEWERLALAEAKVRGDGSGPHEPLPTFQPGPPSAPQFPQIRLPNIPRQDNYCDCGLFVLSYMDFFCHDAPDVMPKAYIEDLKKKEGANALQNGKKSIPSRNPDFLTTRWFSVLNAGGLRWHVRFLCHQFMLQQADDQVTHECDLLREGIVQYEIRAKNKMIGQCYVPPSEYYAFMHAQQTAAQQQQEQQLDSEDMQEGCQHQAQQEQLDIPDSQEQQREHPEMQKEQQEHLGVQEEQQEVQEEQHQQQHQQLGLQEQQHHQQQEDQRLDVLEQRQHHQRQDQQDEPQQMQPEQRHGVQQEQDAGGQKDITERVQKAREVELEHKALEPMQKVLGGEPKQKALELPEQKALEEEEDQSEDDFTEKERQKRQRRQRQRERRQHPQQQQKQQQEQKPPPLQQILDCWQQVQGEQLQLPQQGALRQQQLQQLGPLQQRRLHELGQNLEEQGQQMEQQATEKLQEKMPLESDSSDGVFDEDQQPRELHTMEPDLRDLVQQNMRELHAKHPSLQHLVQQQHHHHHHHQQHHHQHQQQQRCRSEQQHQGHHQEGRHSTRGYEKHGSMSPHHQQHQAQCEQPPQKKMSVDEDMLPGDGQESPQADDESEDLQPHTYTKHPQVLHEQRVNVQLVPPGERTEERGVGDSPCQRSVCDMTVDDEEEQDEVQELGMEGGDGAKVAGPGAQSPWASRHKQGGAKEGVRDQDALHGQSSPGHFSRGGRQQQQQLQQHQHQHQHQQHQHQHQQQVPSNSLDGVDLHDGRQEQSVALAVNGAMESEEDRSGEWHAAGGDVPKHQKYSKKERKERQRLRAEKRHAEQQGQHSGGSSSSKGSSIKQQRSS